jgi:hypothetical protein
MLLRRLAPLLLLAVTTALIWCVATHRWTRDAWRTPMQLHGDPVEIYARVSAAAEDLSQPLRGFSSLPRLAAPFGADWSRYPISDRVVFTLLGALARGVGVFAAVNLAIVIVHVLDALAFYLCARFLRWRWEWAFAVALLFTFANYNFRWGVTVSFSLTFALPPLMLLCGWIARAAPAVRARSWTWLAVLLGAWMGGGSPYLGFFAAQLVGWSVVLQWLRRREFLRWRAGLVFLATAAVSFVLHNAAYFLAPAEGARLTLARNFAGSEIYALKFLDLLVPPAEHLCRSLGQIGRTYYAQSALRGEFFINYLGVFGILGLVIVLGRGFRPMLERSAKKIPDAFLSSSWILIFSAVGGVGSLIALGGFDVFRASNRNSIFILVLALFAFGRWCQRLRFTQRTGLRFALPIAVAIIGVVDALPRLNAASSLVKNAAALDSQRQLLHSLEQRIGQHASVFQLPATSFPEAGAVFRMSDYEHLSAYLLSDTLRWSYGALRGTPEARTLEVIGHMPVAQLKNELESSGFGAVWIDRRGFPDNADRMIEQLRAAGVEEFKQDKLADIAIFVFRPPGVPRALDLKDARYFEPWISPVDSAHPAIAVIDGWYDVERNGSHAWRWARERAATYLRVAESGKVEVTFSVRSLVRGQLILKCDGREVLRQPVSLYNTQASVSLHLTAGTHSLDWTFTGGESRPMSADSRLLAFAIEDLSVAAR